MSYETVRRVNHFGPTVARALRKRRPKPHASWHLDEMYLRIAGRMVYLSRAVDAEGEVLDVLVQPRRNKPAALKLMLKLLNRYGFVPNRLTTDKLPSYAGALRHLGIEADIKQIGGRTIAPRIHISRPIEGSVRCSDSRAPDRLKDFSQPTPPSATSSTSNATSHRERPTGRYAPER